MKYCPNCKRDFEDGTAFCRWCEVDLVDSLEPVKEVVEEEFEAEPTDAVKIYTAFDVMQAAEIEKAFRKAGIPVWVKPAEPLDAEEETPAQEEPAEEVIEETPAEEPKKGFFARLFGKKDDRPLPKDDILFGDDLSDDDGELLDILVPAAEKTEATALLNRVLGIETEQEVAVYDEEELVD